MLEHIERLKAFQALALPEDIGQHNHQNRLLKMAREGEQMTPKDLGKFEDERRWPWKAWQPSPTRSSTCTTVS
jgi:hypothetical protein